MAEIVAELLLELSELLELPVPDVELARGVAVLRVNTCPVVTWWFKSPAVVAIVPP